MFKICRDSDTKVSNCWVNGSWIIPFVRTFGVEEKLQWAELKLILEEVVFKEAKDQVCWVLKSPVCSRLNLYIGTYLLGVWSI